MLSASAHTQLPVATVTHPVVVRMRGVRKACKLCGAIETEALHGIDLTGVHGKPCAVVGPSGFGKSTWLNCRCARCCA